MVQPDSRALFASVRKQLRDMTDRNFLREEGVRSSVGSL